jgi:hypothetical protein
MLKIAEVGAVLVDLRNKALAFKAKGEVLVGFVDVDDLYNITTVCLTKLARRDVNSFVRYLQAQSAWHSDTFDFIVTTLFEQLNVVGTCDNGYGRLEPCWEDFEKQFLTA